MDYINNMSQSNVLNVIGLVVDIFGVIGLFLDKDIGLRKLSTFQKIRISSTWHHTNKPEDLIVKEINELKNEINNIIEKTNETNNKTAQKCIKWMVLIIAGFLIQIASLVLCH